MPNKFILEKEKRFSESLLWELQNKAYAQFGPKAWSEKGVPFYVTSNPWTARSYAELVLGFLKDVKLNRQDPLYIFDLGAGSGRFAFLFLKQFLPFAKDLKIRYVMTDFAEANLAFWQQHPLLKPYFEQGVLEACLFHHSQRKLDYASSNPFILIANYFFDTIPQELFRVKNGKLEEGFVTLLTKQEWRDHTDPELINELETEYAYKQTNLLPYSGKMQNLLKECEKILEGPFLFPVGALQTIDFFAELSCNNFFLIAGDQGVATLEQMKQWGEPKLALHGSFSIAVSYYLIARYLGTAFLPSKADPAFLVMAGTGAKGDYPETARAFATFIDAFEPKDYWRLGLELEKNHLTIGALLLLIKWGNYDPMAFNAYFNEIRNAPKVPKEELLFTIDQVYDRFYPIAPEDGAFVTNLGVLCFEMQEYQKALDFFAQAIAIQGETEQLFANKAACLKMLEKTKFLN